MQCRRSRTHAVSTGQTDFPVKFHGENTPALPGVRKGKSGRLLRRPQPDHPAATVDEFCTAVLRYGAGSTLITSQLPLSTWHDVIGEPTFADAILDRIVHNAYRLELSGQSLRKTMAKTGDENCQR